LQQDQVERTDERTQRGGRTARKHNAFADRQV